MKTNAPQFLSKSVQRWFNRGEVRSINGHEIFVIDEGRDKKSTIVLIHGFPTSSYDFDRVWETLSESHRLVCIDMLGFGFSDKPNKRDYTLHKQADLFDSLIRELGIEEYHVFAHDYGVSVAQELLARQIDDSANGKWLSCCFLNGGLFPETHKALLIQKIMLSSAGRLVNKFAGFRQFGASFSKVFGEKTKPSNDELREFWEIINYKDGRHLFHNLMTYILDRREHRGRWVSALQNSPSPISIINGSVDPVSGKHLVKRYRELNCRLDHLVELPTIGHYPHVEAPNEVCEAYLDFLRELP
ncbi:MAG: pimeloyl-ACP methyl ester carboxylesterase [Paracoccaceae bacterium]|jgi:pimeloyl-ACP methyl ester carboxylesterase